MNQGRRRDAPDAASAWRKIANQSLPDDDSMDRGETGPEPGAESLVLSQIQRRILQYRIDHQNPGLRTSPTTPRPLFSALKQTAPANP